MIFTHALPAQRLPAPHTMDPLIVNVAHDARVDVLLVHAVTGMSRRRIHALFDGGAVLVNGRRARKGDPVHAGDIVTVDQTLLSGALRLEPDLPVRILIENDVVIAVDKPAGLASVARSTSDLGTLANFLIARFPDLRSASPNPLEAGLVHRLDTATSGVLLAARSPEAYQHFRRTFARTAIKDYVAVVRGTGPRVDRITTPIAHVPRRPRRMRVCTTPAVAKELSARSADTAYRAVQRDAEGAWLAVRIRTGVRHQIRVHLASVRLPVAGDPLYDTEATVAAPPARLLLHAYRLRLPQPLRGASLDIIAELPSDFAAVLVARGWRCPQPSDWDDL